MIILYFFFSISFISSFFFSYPRPSHNTYMIKSTVTYALFQCATQPTNLSPSRVVPPPAARPFKWWVRAQPGRLYSVVALFVDGGLTAVQFVSKYYSRNRTHALLYDRSFPVPLRRKKRRC